MLIFKKNQQTNCFTATNAKKTNAGSLALNWSSIPKRTKDYAVLYLNQSLLIKIQLRTYYLDNHLPLEMCFSLLKYLLKIEYIPVCARFSCFFANVFSLILTCTCITNKFFPSTKIDWLTVLCFTPHRQYSSHVTAVTKHYHKTISDNFNQTKNWSNKKTTKNNFDHTHKPYIDMICLAIIKLSFSKLNENPSFRKSSS